MGTSVTCSTLTSPGSGIIISLHDSSFPLILSDSDTPSPYFNPSLAPDQRAPCEQPPCRIGRY
jgi:hypothetical protein